MRLAIHALAAFLVTLMVVACATAPIVSADYDRSADFTTYRTFAFVDELGTDTSGYASLVTQTLKAATQREMEARGYRYAETDADLLVNFNARLAQETRVTQTPAPTPMYYGYRRGFYGGWGSYDTRVDQYVEGTLNIDLVDARRMQLVWEGIAVGCVTAKQRQDRAAVLGAAVAEIFKQYPFRAGG